MCHVSIETFSARSKGASFQQTKSAPPRGKFLWDSVRFLKGLRLYNRWHTLYIFPGRENWVSLELDLLACKPHGSCLCEKKESTHCVLCPRRVISGDPLRGRLRGWSTSLTWRDVSRPGLDRGRLWSPKMRDWGGGPQRSHNKDFRVTEKFCIRICYQQSHLCTLGSSKNSHEGTSIWPSNCTPVWIYVHTKICTQMFTEASFATSKNWK